ncbi:thiamine-phosphate kinase [candidate division WOR-1 bacterium RIFOXYA12_FULL_43_27]|uniref:Thiamine-monophosphate kinase n=1 Tax=candidate division WOR-1 bacterium RIFOXYC2_FULL_46_14 TaxID=1802587 RepID=A0A1F4U8W0_UNCSA|nr:MAG: thiamine-phosphate kinase [candidate division WOR-1 bacterium RIFOXYA12_FULL_43_27]OGC19133.1 MAG: thiamine-phosphate kinase [candidate division WOR-1 bacterium RIFOXYB2_FULL_46_45]OGC30121.1 MAG: thiamine-phosphate kinase [candidate division WOR-1 bacterium RIFOXYA2_FULL_46_56]OGC40723.1 MAG: thiamine-phosphate kinase [candidate division WOR-1 bacterium RIFOXYC2_FULL_46_14]
MKLSQLGEFGLIELIKKAQKAKRKDTVLGIGDDCAALRMTNDKCPPCPTQVEAGQMSNYLLITTDTLIEDVHFDLKHTSFYELGYKAMLANISDIAAMGGTPMHAVVTIGVSKNIKVKKLLEFQKGLNKLTRKYNIEIVGGDTVASPKAVMVSITLLGEVEKRYLLTRAGARIGDTVLVTGEFGGPAALGYKPKTLNPKQSQNSNFQNPKIEEGQKIAKSRLATAMIDSSDGLARSVTEICRASKAGAKLYFKNIPIAKGATLDHALYGGEEYELVFTAPKRNVNKLQKIVKCKVVGEIVAKGSNFEKGFQHFV